MATGPLNGLGHIAPRNETTLLRRIEQMERDIAAQRTARSGNATKIDGTLTVAGTVDVSGTEHVGGNLVVDGTADLAGSTSVGGTLTVDGVGKIVVNPSGPTVEMGAGAGGGLVSFQPSDATVHHAGVLLADLSTASFLAVFGPIVGAGTPPQINISTTEVTTYADTDIKFHLATGSGDWVLDATSFGSATNSAAWVTAASEWRAQDGFSGTYIPIRASAFTVSSSRAVKRDIEDLPFDALAAVQAALPQSWRYRADHATDPNRHISPMADDLPAELVQADGDDLAVDTRDLVGVLWAAVGQLAARVEQLESRT